MPVIRKAAAIRETGALMLDIQFAKRMAGVKPNAVGELLRLGAQPDIMSFGGGYPDASLFPLEQLNAVYQTAIAELGQSSLQYTVSNGLPKLREQIAARMNREGINCTAENILVLQGSQQGHLELQTGDHRDPGKPQFYRRGAGTAGPAGGSTPTGAPRAPARGGAMPFR